MTIAQRTGLQRKRKVRARPNIICSLWRPKKATGFKATISNRGHLLIFRPVNDTWKITAGYPGEVVLVWLLIDGKRSTHQIWHHCQGAMKRSLFEHLLSDLQIHRLIV